jgi:hypothetical protein
MQLDLIRSNSNFPKFTQICRKFRLSTSAGRSTLQKITKFQRSDRKSVLNSLQSSAVDLLQIKFLGLVWVGLPKLICKKSNIGFDPQILSKLVHVDDRSADFQALYTG